MISSYTELDILILDDEKFVRSTIRKMLNLLRVRLIREATNGTHALVELEQCPEADLPNLILCDLEMEPIGGAEFVAKIRNHDNRELSELPIIIATAHSDVEAVRSVVSSGIEGYVVKPFNKQQLANAIQRIISQIPARSPSQTPDPLA